MPPAEPQQKAPPRSLCAEPHRAAGRGFLFGAGLQPARPSTDSFVSDLKLAKLYRTRIWS